MILRPTRTERATYAALVAFGALGCAPAPFTTAAELPNVPRSPDGVLIDPPPALPDATDRAPAQGVVALRVPIDMEVVRRVVSDLLAAFVREDIDAIDAMLTRGATPLDAGRHGSVRESWEAKIHNLDYKKLAGQELVRWEHIERAEYGELGGHGQRARPHAMRPGDLLVRVPIAITTVGADQFFPDVLVLLLRPDERGVVKIAGAADENAQ